MTGIRLYIILCILSVTAFGACSEGIAEEERLQYVDTRIGTAPSVTHTAGLFGKNTEEYGQTLPAVLEPNGMNFWTPQTRDTEEKCIAPYYYADSLLQGFRNSHWIVGGCTQDYGSMTLMPLFSRLRCMPEARATRFSHQTEQATPAYYAVSLPDEALTAEMTARSRSSIFRFTYQKSGKAYLVVNPNSDEGQGFISVDTVNNVISGYNPVHRIYQGWGEPAGYSGHFVVRFQKKITGFGVFRGDSIFPARDAIGNACGIGAYVEFDVHEGESLLVKAASSFVSVEGAMSNLEAEIPHWDFDRTRRELTDIWGTAFGACRGADRQPRSKGKILQCLIPGFFPAAHVQRCRRPLSFVCYRYSRTSASCRTYLLRGLQHVGYVSCLASVGQSADPRTGGRYDAVACLEVRTGWVASYFPVLEQLHGCHDWRPLHCYLGRCLL